MKKFIPTLLLFAVFSCKQKGPSHSDFMQRAIKSDNYKIVSANFQRVNDSLDLIKKRPVDTAAVIYEYNTIVGSRTVQAKTMGQVINEMNKMNNDSSFLKTVQIHMADSLEKYHRDSTKKLN